MRLIALVNKPFIYLTHIDNATDLEEIWQTQVHFNYGPYFMLIVNSMEIIYDYTSTSSTEILEYTWGSSYTTYVIHTNQWQGKYKSWVGVELKMEMMECYMLQIINYIANYVVR